MTPLPTPVLSNWRLNISRATALLVIPTTAGPTSLATRTAGVSLAELNFAEAADAIPSVCLSVEDFMTLAVWVCSALEPSSSIGLPAISVQPETAILIAISAAANVFL